MSLLAPLMLLGLLGLGLPLLAHLRGKEQPRVVRFAGLRFLAATDEVITQRRRLRDGLLLLVRLALLALLIVALTRPVSSGDARVAVLGEPHDALLLLDASFSMALRSDGESLRAASEDAAAAILEALPPGSRVGLLTTDPAGPRLELSADPDRVRAAVETWAAEPPRAGAWALESGLPGAVVLLRQAGDGPGRRVVYAIGDFTGRGLGSLPATAGTDIPVLPVAARGDLSAPPPVPEHMSLQSASWTPARELDPRAVRISGAVRRHGGATDGPARRVALVLRVDGEVAARAEVDVPVDGLAPYEFTHIGAAAGPTPASVEITGIADDALPGDEARHLWLASEDGIEVALVNGDPSEMRAHDELYFLATAVSAGAGAQRLRVHSLAPDQLEARLREGDRLADVDVLVLANLRAPAEDIAPILKTRVAEGMGLWISVGDRVDARAYNERLGELLPLLLREPLLVGTAPGRTEARTEGVAPPNLAHPILLGLQGELGLLGTRTRRLFLLEPDPGRGAEVALSFTSGAPALLSRPYERGRVVLLTTSIDRDWSDLPLRPGFVPLAERVLAWLDSSHPGAAAGQIFAGEPRIIPSEGPVTVRLPDGRERVIPPERAGQAVFKDTFIPGHYSVTRPGGQPLTFAVQQDPEESDTTPVAVRPPTLDGDQVLAAAQHPRWRPLVLLAAALLLLETLLRARARR